MKGKKRMWETKLLNKECEKLFDFLTDYYKSTRW